MHLKFIRPLCVLVIQSAKLLISYCVWKLPLPSIRDPAGWRPLLGSSKECFNDPTLTACSGWIISTMWKPYDLFNVLSMLHILLVLNCSMQWLPQIMSPKNLLVSVPCWFRVFKKQIVKHNLNFQCSIKTFYYVVKLVIWSIYISI